MGAIATMLAACDKASPPPPPASPPTAMIATAPSDPACPATGLWAECSLGYRLERAGLAPKIDSTATPGETVFTGKRIMLKIGRSAELELYLYPDSAARLADEERLDRARFVNATAPQSIARERTLIESANVFGLLTSLDSHQRERVSDAITAGPPQPPSNPPQKLPPTKSK